MPATIFITEDEILIAREIEATLQELGYTVAGIARDGNTALQRIQATKPDLVLMDIVIAGEMDGIETANQIRTQLQIPVVFLTAYTDINTLKRAKGSEPFGYLQKPFQPPELDRAIQLALMRHQSEKSKLNALRRNISASLPHEIKTPLSGILGLTDFLLEYHDSVSPDELRETLKHIQTSAMRLDRLFQNALLYSRLEFLSANPSQLALMKQQCAHFNQPLITDICLIKAQEFNRSADLQLNLEEAIVQISEPYLHKIVTELLDNAFKFSAIGTAVCLKSVIYGAMLKITVSNQGRTLTDEQIANLGAFMQFDRAYYEQQGVGMGLALVQQLTNLHDGNLTIESTETTGTTVTVQLPIADPSD